MPTYTSNTPIATDLLSQDQPLMLQNFQQIAAALAENHMPFNSGTDGAGLIDGRHTVSEYVTQSSAPAITVTEMAIYNATTPYATSAVSGGGGQALYVINGLTGGKGIPFTAANTINSGFTYLPSGILLKWGIVVSGGTQPNNYNFTTGLNIPAFNNILSMVVGQYNGEAGADINMNVCLNSFSATGFNLWFSARTSTGPAPSGARATYIAIGY